MRIVLFLLANIFLLHSHAAQEKPASPQFKVLSYNIHHAEGTDDKLDVHRIADIIKSTKADVIAVQEVDRHTIRTKKVDQAAELGKLAGMHVEFAKAIDYQGGEYGLAILSRWPIKEVKVHKLPRKEKQEQRLVMEARIEPGEGRPAFTFLNTHLQHDDNATREQQVARIEELFSRHPGPVILAGDLNARHGSNPIKTLAQHWTFATPPGDKTLLTIPSDSPKQQIDYVLFKPAGRFRIVESKVIEEKIASDHRPVYSVLQWTER
jgi:endonuclease/exonuclease/phosphatase family metal-dependent hydrolase